VVTTPAPYILTEFCFELAQMGCRVLTLLVSAGARNVQLHTLQPKAISAMLASSINGI
jgi:hypothetical protein